MCKHYKFIIEIADSIRRYSNNGLITCEIDRLVKSAATIAQNKLWGRLHAAAREQETRVEHLAISVVASMFTGKGSDSPLAEALENVLDSDDVTLFLRFRNIVVRTASQELFHRWGENDALSARLWRSLHRVIRRDVRMVVFPIDNPEWISLTDVTDLKANLPPVNHDEIVRIISSQEQDHRGFADLIVAILSAVVKASGCQNAVRVDLLFSALRETTHEIKVQQLVDEVPCNRSDPFLSVAIDRATQQVLHNVEAKLGRYQAAEKLHPDVVKLFRLALSDLVADCANGGPAQSYYEYLRVHRPDLSLEGYRRTLRTRFEYLAESVRKDFIEEMRKRYF